VGVNSLYT